MRRSVFRWITFLFAMLVIGPLAGRLVAWPRGIDGALRSEPIMSHLPGVGLGVSVGAVVIAGAYSFLVARRLGIAAGMNAAGVIFAWCAWNCGSIDALLRSAPHASTLVSLSIEAAVLGLASLLLVVLLARKSSDADSLRSQGPLLSVAHGLSLVVAICLGGLCVSLMAFQPLKGQAVFAALVGSVAIGAVTQLGAASAGRFVPMVIPFAAGVMLAMLAPLVALQWHGSKIIEATRAGDLLGVAVPHGFDWLCGWFFGIPVGVAWAESMMERGHPSTAGQQAA